MNKLSIIIPALNEEHNVKPLIERLDKTLKENNIVYEVIFIDDHSTDSTYQIISTLAKQYPIIHAKKKGRRGKAYSIIEGFDLVHYPLVAIIDADLQYPPEAIPQMVEAINKGADVIVANRKVQQISLKRRIVSKTFSFLFGKVLHGLDCDVQSGLKVFREEIIERIELDPTGWTFDLEFLLKAQNAGYKISSIDIIFANRTWGKTKVGILKTSLEIGLNALLLKLDGPQIEPFHPEKTQQYGLGFHYKGKEFVDYTDLHYKESAFHGLTIHQKLFLFFAIALFGFSLFYNWHTTVVASIAGLSFLYFGDLLFNFFLIYRSFISKPEINVSRQELADIPDHLWPRYTVVCPLYKEWQVIHQFVKAMKRLDYPKDKLQVLLLLEQDDEETIALVKRMRLPKYFEVAVIPQSQPKTKPKALNYGLSRATGEYAVIYDAEDIPEPKQLKKAVMAFSKQDNRTICVQAKLNFYNPRQNILTRIFTSEYSLWFDLVLPGLQSINAPIPLGGTSNHFRIRDLKALKGWDPFNVTEDCDLGMRLVKHGYQTAILDSTTTEEANSSLKNWVPQRTRWIKGYIQTYLVHMRHPLDFMRNWREFKLVPFHLIVGGKIMSMLINPFMWLTTFSYFAFRATLGPTIESFFPSIVFYIAVVSLIVGNFLYFYYYMIGNTKRELYDLVKYVFLVPFYWIGMSVAAWKALIEVITKPHYWAKTLHGLHLVDPQQAKKVKKIIQKQYVDDKARAYVYESSQ